MGVRHTETSLIIWSQAAQSSSAPSATAGMAAPVAGLHVPPQLGADRFYDAGDKGCALGPMDEIAAVMRTLATGQTLEVHATDPSVAADLAAWCRMTNNQLTMAGDGRYLLQKG